MKHVKIIFSFITMYILCSFLVSQDDPEMGDGIYTLWGIMDGNAVRTLYANHAEVAHWPDQPSGEWPKGTGHSYVDGVATIIAASAYDTLGNRIHPMSTNYREFIDTDPETHVPWGWGPLPGYANYNRLHPVPARSDDTLSWPFSWPDQPGWTDEWNGYFGRGVYNADLETYFICDDAPDKEWHFAQDQFGGGVFYPTPDDRDRGGLGMQIEARGFQWSHVLAQDVIFWHYEIINESEMDYDSVYFAQYIDWGIGGTDDSGDDEGGYNMYLDLAFAWDYNGVGQPGGWGPTGVASYAFLESPGVGDVYTDDGQFISGDELDNDQDGLVDESRNNPYGEWLDIYPYGVDDVDDFIEFFDREPRPHFEGDEDQDWFAFEDFNGDGIWNDGEPINDDVGEDGLAPYHLNYPGPDLGEADGVPTDGEPNFNQTDKDESDQLGLTGFSVFNVHDYELQNDEQNWNDIFVPTPPPTSDVYLEGGRNLGMFFSSGPFPMASGQTERFSMALIFAEKDFPDAPDEDQIRNSSLARKKETVQQIYNADYRFAQPPLKPNLNAVAGDDAVILFWDDRSESSFDPFSREFDFEGYKLYRSTEPFFEEIKTITDTYGENTFKQPLAQWDLDNDIEGLHPVDINGVKLNLGIDSGLRHFYIDTDVRNGMTYYYALVAYDRGIIGIDTEGNIIVDDDGHTRGISPSECSAIIREEPAGSGNYTNDINTAIVTPRADAAGFVPGSINEDVIAVWGALPSPATGFIDIMVIENDSLQNDHEYQLEFMESTFHYNDPTPLLKLTDLTTEEVVLDSFEVSVWGHELPVVDGLGIVVYNDSTVTTQDTESGWLEGSMSNFELSVQQLIEDDELWSEFGAQKMPYPADYHIIFEADTTIVDTSMRLNPFLSGATNRIEVPVPFRIWNITEQRWAKR